MSTLFRYLFLCTFFFVVGGLSVNVYWKRNDNGYSALITHPILTEQILRNSHVQIINDDCFSENGGKAKFYVADFLMDYFRHFSNPNFDRYSGFVHCGFIGENICEIYFGERNVEGEKGVSNHLRFEIDPITDQIKTDTFVCWGF